MPRQRAALWQQFWRVSWNPLRILSPHHIGSRGSPWKRDDRSPKAPDTSCEASLLGGQGEVERYPFPGTPFGPYPAAVTPDDAPHDREAHAVPVEAAGVVKTP